MNLSGTRILSKRLDMRAFTPADAKEVYGAVTPRLTQYMSWSPAPSLGVFSETWKRWLVKMAAGTDVSLVIRMASSQEFLGVQGLHGVTDLEPEVGIWIKEAAQNRGYGSEAVGTLITWAAHILGRQAVLYPAVEENAPSRRIAEKLGGVIIGAKRHRKSPTVEHNLVLYRIPARELEVE
jgi:RimJ/RimL family protein N-acetyltransferase